MDQMLKFFKQILL